MFKRLLIVDRCFNKLTTLASSHVKASHLIEAKNVCVPPVVVIVLQQSGAVVDKTPESAKASFELILLLHI